jgi:hypothetical protein
VAKLLAAHGFVAVRLEGLGFDALVPPGTRVIELMPHHLRPWCYRRRCAVRELPYEALLGEQEDGAATCAGFKVDLGWVRSAVATIA